MFTKILKFWANPYIPDCLFDSEMALALKVASTCWVESFHRDSPSIITVLLLSRQVFGVVQSEFDRIQVVDKDNWESSQSVIFSDLIPMKKLWWKPFASFARLSVFVEKTITMIIGPEMF